MKLIYSKCCDSVTRLTMKPRTCECWKTGGVYIDKLNAIYYWLQAHPFWIDNRTFWIRLREDIMENTHYNIMSKLDISDWTFKAFSLLRNINGCWDTFKKKTKKYYNKIIHDK